MEVIELDNIVLDRFYCIWIESKCRLLICIKIAYVQDARLMEESTIIIERGRQHCVIVVING